MFMVMMIPSLNFRSLKSEGVLRGCLPLVKYRKPWSQTASPSIFWDLSYS